MTTANEVVWSLGSEAHLTNNSKINMEQIRSTMLYHEELFKEQVQTLHKLYRIQISAMQEIKRRIYTQAQVMSFGNSQMCGSVLERKPLMNPQTDKEESLNLSLHPFCASNEFMGLKSNHDTRNKPVRGFDLERLPEECIDGSEILVASNSSKISGNRMYATEAKATEDSRESYMPAVGYSLVGSNPKSRLDKPMSHQGLVSVDPGQNDPTRTAKQTKENSVPSSNQNLDTKVSQLNDYINGISLSTRPAILSQGSSNQEDSKYHHSFIIQTSNSSERNSSSGNQNTQSCEFLNDSGNGSNSTVHSQGTKGFKDQNINANTENDNVGFGDEIEAIRSEPEDVRKHTEESNPEDESVAAEILLSFIDSKPHEQVELDSSRPNKVNAVVEKKWNLRERRSTNLTYDIVNEPTKWMKMVRRRRTSRKAR